MVISNELQKRFQFKFIKKAKVSDSQNRSKVQNYVQLDSMYLGGILFGDLVAIEADLRYSPVLACLGIDGIVGANLMRHAFWEMDAGSGFLRMSSSREGWPLDNPLLISKPFRAKSTYTPLVEMRVDNTLYRNITFDTGSGDLLSLGKKDNTNFNADSVAFRAYGFLSAGLFGSNIDTVQSQFLDLYLDSIPFHSPIEFGSTNDSRLLGMDFFKHFRIYMDWPSRKMHFLAHEEINFRKKKAYPTSPYLEGKAIRVGQINSLTEREGLELSLGDTIAMINDESFYPATQASYCRVIEIFKNQMDLRLFIRNKGEVLVRKQDVFPSENLLQSP